MTKLWGGAPGGTMQDSHAGNALHQGCLPALGSAMMDTMHCMRGPEAGQRKGWTPCKIMKTSGRKGPQGHNMSPPSSSR